MPYSCFLGRNRNAIRNLIAVARRTEFAIATFEISIYLYLQRPVYQLASFEIPVMGTSILHHYQ